MIESDIENEKEEICLWGLTWREKCSMIDLKREERGVTRVCKESESESEVAQLCPTLRPQGLQHAWLPCPSPPPGACSNSCPSSQWCHPTISSSVVPFPSSLQSFVSSGAFSNEAVLHIRWPKYWSFTFSISPSNEYSGLISFRIDWLDLLAVQGLSRVFSFEPQFKSINSSVLSFLFSPISHPYIATGKNASNHLIYIPVFFFTLEFIQGKGHVIRG